MSSHLSPRARILGCLWLVSALLGCRATSPATVVAAHHNAAVSHDVVRTAAQRTPFVELEKRETLDTTSRDTLFLDLFTRLEMAAPGGVEPHAQRYADTWAMLECLADDNYELLREERAVERHLLLTNHYVGRRAVLLGPSLISGGVRVRPIFVLDPTQHAILSATNSMSSHLPD